MNIFGLSFVLFLLKWSAGKGFQQPSAMQNTCISLTVFSTPSSGSVQMLELLRINQVKTTPDKTIQRRS